MHYVDQLRQYGISISRQSGSMIRRRRAHVRVGDASTETVEGQRSREVRSTRIPPTRWTKRLAILVLNQSVNCSAERRKDWRQQGAWTHFGKARQTRQHQHQSPNRRSRSSRRPRYMSFGVSLREQQVQPDVVMHVNLRSCRTRFASVTASRGRLARSRDETHLSGDDIFAGHWLDSRSGWS